jgi:hypothetical protein
MLHASWGRPAKAVVAMRQCFERALVPEGIEYIFAINADDQALPVYMELLEWMKVDHVKIITGPFTGSAQAWDAAAQSSSGAVLIQTQDDLELPESFDRSLWNLLGDRLAPPTFIAVSDGYRKDRLCCTAIMNRARYEQAGEFLHPGYRSVFSDDDLTIRAYADAADGKCTLIEARDLVFLHRHHYHDKSVPFDATYARENSAEAYAEGQALFMKRNAELVRRGLKTW